MTFGYDEQETVLRHLSFQVAEGEQVTLTGRTGAGKSTVFKLLLGLYAPQEGAVLLQGVPASEPPPGGAAEALRLRGAELPPGARHRPGPDHPLRPCRRGHGPPHPRWTGRDRLM